MSSANAQFIQERVYQLKVDTHSSKHSSYHLCSRSKLGVCVCKLY